MAITLVLGGARSGKSAFAENLAHASTLPVTYIATGLAGDAEMTARILQHRAHRPAHWRTVEAPLALADALEAHAAIGGCVLVDCLTLWLTNSLFPSADFESNRPLAQELPARAAIFLIAIEKSLGPVVVVSNEIGLGVIPMGRPTREFVDTLGRLNQDVAQVCERVTLMAAGLPLTLKGQP